MTRIKRLGLRLFLVLKECIACWREDNGERLAAALSYYTIFSLIPSLIIVIGVVGLVIDQKQVEDEVVLQFQRFVGSDAAGFIRQMLQDRMQLNRDNNLLATVVGVITLLFGASGLFVQLQYALNTVWRIRVKPTRGLLNLLRTRLFSFVILLLAGGVLVLSLIIDTGLVLVDDWLRVMMPNMHLLFNAGNTVISFGVTMLLFALLYKIMPDTTIRWHDTWVGAGVTALLFGLGRWGIALYLGNSTLVRTFGAAGALVAMMVWVYYSAQIVLFGAEFIKAFALQRGRAVLPASHAVNIRWHPEDVL
jgi:membrane protein